MIAHAARCHVWDCTYSPDPVLQEELLTVGAVFTDGEYEYQDNFRAALLADPAAMKHYEDQKMAGCCGQYDFRIDTPWGPAMYGFNYGH